MDAAQAYRADPLAEGGADRPPSPAETTTEDDEFARVDARDLVERLVGRLPPREQLIVRLRFHEEMTQADIASRLGISQMHVSRLLRQSLDTLRAAHADDAP